jgi:hypothetical protein
VVITLSWSQGPANLDLHVATPATDEDEGGEVSASSPCLARNDGTCWATASGDATAFGSETVTLHPLGSPDPGDWLPGGHRVWVENTSCIDGTYGSSNAVVTISRTGESISLPVSGAGGDPSHETWDVASVHMDRLGSMAVAGIQSLFGDPCGASPPPPARFASAVEGNDDGAADLTVKSPPAAEPPTANQNTDEVSADPAPPSPEPMPDPQPEADPEPQPEPDPPAEDDAVLPEDPVVEETPEVPAS